MAYQRVILNVYSSLASTILVDPNLLFYVDTSQILDFDIEPDIFVADDAFSIRGRTAKMTMTWEKDIRHHLQSKQVCALYPEYLNSIFDIVNLDDGTILFRGALRLDEIQHDYDATTFEITLRDPIDIWITQAKKTFFTATDAVNDWSIDPTHARTFETLLSVPVQYLLMGMNGFYRNFTNITPQMVYNLQIDFENYANDFSTWQPMHNGAVIPADWQAKYVVVRYDSVAETFQVNLIHSFDENPGTWYYRVYKAVFDKTNLIQPKHERYIEMMSSQSVNQVSILLERLLGVNVMVTESNHITVSNVYIATNTIDGYEYTVNVTGDMVTVNQPFQFKTILLSNGKHSYSDITYALLTANALSLTRSNYAGKHIVDSGLSSALDFSGGLALADQYVINQKRDGLFADYSRIDSAFSITRYSKANTIKALQQIYAERLAQIGVRLTFQIPVSYRDTQGITLQTKLNIDGQTYIVSSMGFPQDDLVEIECIGYWE